MTRPSDGVPPKPGEFRDRAREAFAFLATTGFREERVPSEKNPVAVWFTNGVARVVVEGINWGLNTRVALGRAGASTAFENYDLGDLLAVRAPNHASLPTGGQVAQLSQYAAALREYGADILAGDFAVFPQLQARVDERIARHRKQ